MNTNILQQALAYIQDKIGDFQPKLALILGSGCGPLVDPLTKTISIPYQDIPGFGGCSVKGHAGKLVFGYHGACPVMCFQGRMHWYEGHDLERMRLPLQLVHGLDCSKLWITNAVGSLRSQWQPGQLVLINDHINFQGRNPLVGLNDGVASIFVGMENAYDKASLALWQSIAAEKNINLPSGVYLATLGPNFETPAEIKAFHTMGADVVGMSTVSEVLLAAYYKIQVSVISMVTNLACGLSDVPLSHEVTLAGAQSGIRQLVILFEAYCQEQLALQSKDVIS